MARIATYVFIDLETTGLPSLELNKTRITELSMVAVKRLHLEHSKPGSVPRVQHKLTLCLYPRMFISDVATEVTGLSNYLLEKEPVFNLDVYNMINTFLNLLTKPVCLVAYNGLNFDYPILKNRLEKLKVCFSDDLLCADCFHGFYEILQERQGLQNNTNNITSITQQTPTSSNLTLLSNEADKSPPKTDNISSKSLTNTAVDEADFFSSNLQMQAVNETTPKHNRFAVKRKISSKVSRRMPWGNKKPDNLYKLEDVYNRVVKKTVLCAHRAETDCLLALEIAASMSDKFIKWIDNNHVEFTEIKPMTIGVKVGS